MFLSSCVSLTCCSFLSTSNEAVYKVFNESACQFSGQTCSPEVRMSRNSSQFYALPMKEKIVSCTKKILRWSFEPVGSYK